MSIKLSSEERRHRLLEVYDILVEQNYDPLRQLSGYVLTADPTYIPDYKNARAAIAELDRTDILNDLLHNYFASERKDGTN